jgi:hypothetical protein
MTKDSYILNIITKTAEDCKVKESDVEGIIDGMYSFILGKATEIDYKTLELNELKNLKKNFNIPALGKLYVNEKMFININKVKNE